VPGERESETIWKTKLFVCIGELNIVKIRFIRNAYKLYTMTFIIIIILCALDHMTVITNTVLMT